MTVPGGDSRVRCWSHWPDGEHEDTEGTQIQHWTERHAKFAEQLRTVLDTSVADLDEESAALRLKMLQSLSDAFLRLRTQHVSLYWLTGTHRQEQVKGSLLVLDTLWRPDWKNTVNGTANHSCVHLSTLEVQLGAFTTPNVVDVVLPSELCVALMDAWGPWQRQLAAGQGETSGLKMTRSAGAGSPDRWTAHCEPALRRLHFTFQPGNRSGSTAAEPKMVSLLIDPDDAHFDTLARNLDQIRRLYLMSALPDLK